MYCGEVVRRRDPAVRALLVERAAVMLGQRESITLRALVDGTGVSTMAVYTYFGGMDGLRMAVRQEGFTRLEALLQEVPVTRDPVKDLVALSAAYVTNAAHNPDLYRVMFEDGIALEDPAAADNTLEHLVQAVARARDHGRLRDEVDPLDLATQCWIVGHGLVSLVVTGPLPPQAIHHGAAMLTSLLTGAGDAPDTCKRSVRLGWKPDIPGI